RAHRGLCTYLCHGPTLLLYIMGASAYQYFLLFAAAFVGLRADDLATAHATHAPRAGRSHSFAGQLAGLLHPSGEWSFVELFVLVDVEIAHLLLLGLAGGGEDAATCRGRM